MRPQAPGFRTFLYFLLDHLRQIGNGRVQPIQQLQQIFPPPARPGG
jgi:hypothetical protein